MFDEEYESDQQEDVRMGYKNVSKVNPKALTPSESNMTLSMKQGDQLMKLMKERGIDMKESEINRVKTKQPDPTKKQSKAGFYDGGHSAPLEQLLAALKKAYTNNDPQQASCILSYILENKGLSAEDRSKFGLMKCNLLFNLAAYEECCDRATDLIDQQHNEVAYAQLCNYLAKSKAELGRVWQGYMDLQRAKSLMIAFEGQKKKEAMEDRQTDEEYVDTELDSIIREVSHTEMEYNIRVTKEKSTLNLIYPMFSVFRNRRVLNVSAGEYHVLFLVGAAQYDKELKGRWATQVFGLGENRAGQITGSFEYKTSFAEPVLVKDLSGKGIEGVYAFKETSLAYDECGNVFEWGAKTNGRHNIELSYSLGEKINKIERGNHHYCALTNHTRLFVWGRMEYHEATIFNEPKPFEPKLIKPAQFSCGSNYVLVVDASGELWGIGSNQYGQLASPGSKFFKEMTKINTNKIGRLSRVFCVFECSFMQTMEEELYFCGRHSYNKEPLEFPKQAEFPDEPKIISVSGHPGSYYVTDQNGQAYVWEVDSSVKFKPEKTKERLSQRIVECSKGSVYRVKTLPVASLCTGIVTSKELKTYEPIFVQVSLRDEYGEYGLDLCQPVKYTVHLSRKVLKKEELIEQSEKFLKLTAGKYKENKPFLDQIMGSELVVSKVREVEESQPDKHLLEFSVERKGTYYLYLLMDSVLINNRPFQLVVETSEKEEELERKMQEEKERRRLEREAQKQREEDERRERQEEQQMEIERRKETQKRAEQTYKLHMREQEQQRRKQEEDRKRRAELMVGGGFDLSKMKKKPVEEPVMVDTSVMDAAKLRKRASEEQQDPNMTSESLINRKKLDYENYVGEVPQLPDINARPSSKRKLVLKKPECPPELLAPNKPTVTSTIGKPTEFKTAVPLKRGDSRSKK